MIDDAIEIEEEDLDCDTCIYYELDSSQCPCNECVAPRMSEHQRKEE